MKKESIKFFLIFQILIDKKNISGYITNTSRRWVEQLAARRAHNPEAVGSSPTPAIEGLHLGVSLFLF